MNLEDIAALPLWRISDALAATEHSRKMTGLLLTLVPDLKCAETIAIICMSEAFASTAKAATNDRVSYHLLMHGHLPQERVDAFAEEALRCPKEIKPETCLLLSLASPKLSGHILKKGLAMCQAGSSSSIEINGLRNALWGNPLVHKSNARIPVPAKVSPLFLLNAALFGDLANPNVVSALHASISSDDITKQAGVRPLQRALLLRRNLPEKLLLALDASDNLDADQRRALMERPMHQMLQKQGTVGRTREVDGQIIISPLADAIAIKNASGLVFSLNKLATMLLAAQCPSEHYQAALMSSNECLQSDEFLRHSPFARHHLETRTWPQMRDLFHSKIDMDSGLRTLALPNMSFKEITPARLRECFPPDTIQLADVVGVIRSRKFAENLAGDGSFSPLGSLFSPFTSSRGLDRLVSEHPKLAPLAAIHPNGLHISGNLIPDSNIASLIAKNRGANVLAGRSDARADGRGNALVIE